MTSALTISESQAASVSLGAGTSDLTHEERQKVNRQAGAVFDRRLPALIREQFSLHLDAAKLVSLTGALKTSVRSKLQKKLGVTAETGAGGSGGVSLGGSAGVQGGVSLGASLGLRAGVGVSAGAAGSPLAGIRLQAGTNPQTIPGLTSGIVTDLDPSAGNIRVSAARDIRLSLGAALDEVLGGSGLPAEKQQALKAELEPEIGKAVEDSFRSSFGPSPSYPHAHGKRVLDADIRMPKRGPWRAEVTVDEIEENAPPPEGPFWFESDGVEFRGTALPARSGRSQSGRTRVLVVGGAGGLEHDLEPRNYGSGVTRIKTVVDDILRDAGETLSAESDQALLNQQIAAYHRVSGTGRESLNILCDKLGCEWRVLRDGTVWIGIDNWPEVEPDGVVEDDNWGRGVVSVAPEVPSLVPGVVVRGQRAEEVVHRINHEGLRSEVRSQGVRSAIDRLLDPLRTEMDYTKRYRCEVKAQNGDGTVDVLIDDTRQRGRGVARCAIHVGIPGTTITVPSGARCLVGWRDADPALPYVSDWESGTVLTQIAVAEGTRSAVGVGAVVRVVLPFSPGPTNPPIPFPVFGFVEGPGNQNILV